MAKTNKKMENSVIGGKTTSSYESVSMVGVPRTGSPQPQPAKTLGATGTMPAPSLTRQQIEERAREIWRKKGCPVGQDEKNWLEAEAQLKRELAVK
jgi:hypothetical protein